MLPEPRFSIIVPAHNEQERIGPMLREYVLAFPDSEILVILNGCTDGTLEIVSTIAALHERVAYVEVKQAIGKGGAVRVGMLFARAPVVGYVDADGATPAEEMRRLCESLRPQDDGVIGSRWMRESNVRIEQPFMRRLASRVFNGLVRVLFWLPYHDTQCGAKVFRAEALRGCLRHVETANLAFDVDLLYQLKVRGKRVAEVPTVWNDRLGSQVQLGSASRKMLAALLRLRLRDSLLRYGIPAFDRIFPTAPLRVHDGLAILLINWRDPKHPRAGGAEQYLWEIGKRYVAAGHTVEFLTAGFPGAPREETYDGIKVTRTGNAFTAYLAVGLAYLRRFRDRFDVIVDTENGIPFFSPLFSMKPKVLLMLHVHQRVFEKHLPFPLSSLLKWMEARLMPLVYRNVPFVAISEDTKAEILKYGMTRRPIAIVNPGYNPSLGPGPKTLQPSIAYVGRLKDYKRVDLLIRAMPAVIEAIPGCSLTIAGDGDSLPRLKTLAAELGVEAAVRFEGFVTEERKREILAGAWLFASPSEMEGWGISAVEANACGTPAVVFDVPGLREAVADGVSGAIVRREADLPAVLAELLSDRERLAELSGGALSNAAKYSWDAGASAFERILMQQVVGERFTLVRNRAGWSLLTPPALDGLSLSVPVHCHRDATVT